MLFVADANRLCVALRRARAGTFVLGPGVKYMKYMPRGVNETTERKTHTMHGIHSIPRSVSFQWANTQKQKKRPLVERTTKTSFTSWSDYITVFGYATISEHEVHKRLVTALEHQDLPLVTMTIPHADNKRFFGFIMPAVRDDSGFPSIELYAGDRLFVNLYYGQRTEEDARHNWAVEVLAPKPIVSAGYVPMMLMTPYDKET